MNLDLPLTLMTIYFMFAVLLVAVILRERTNLARLRREREEFKDRIWVLEQQLGRVAYYVTRPCPLCGRDHGQTTITRLPKAPLPPPHHEGPFR